MKLLRLPLLLLLLGSSSSYLAAAPAAAPRPNILLILADDLGNTDLSCFDSADIRTPAIDSLARDGVRFTQFYSNSSECTPSRAALLTGRHPQRVGGLECAIGLGNVGRYDEAVWLQQRGELGLPASELSLGQRLHRSGYATAIFGKWHLGYDVKFSPRRHGFDESLVVLGGAVDYVTHAEEDGTKVMRHNDTPVERPGYLTDVIADHAITWLAQPRTQPFFLYLPFTAPHNPYQGPDDGRATDFTKGTRATYKKMIEHLDKRVGDILAALERTGAARNTIVVFLSDNGGTVAVGNNQPLRGGKTTMWEGGIRVPCVIRWPQGLPAGRTSSQMAQNIDLTATFLAAAGIAPEPSYALDGENLLAVWRGDRPEFPRTLFWRYKRADNRRKAVRDGDWKLVVDGANKELLNVAADPSEKSNLLAAHPERAAALEAKLTAWEKSVAAPRLRDFRPAEQR